MSVQAMTWVLDHSTATLASRLVLLSIANHCGADGTDAWPSQRTIAREAHVSVATVRRCTEDLIERGELFMEVHGGVQGRGGTTNYYEMPEFMASRQVRSNRACLHGKARSSCPKCAHPDAEARSPVSAEPSLEPSIEPRSPQTGGEGYEPLPEDEIRRRLERARRDLRGT